MLSSPLEKSPSGPADAQNGRPGVVTCGAAVPLLSTFPSGETMIQFCVISVLSKLVLPFSNRTFKPVAGTKMIGLFQPSRSSGAPTGLVDSSYQFGTDGTVPLLTAGNAPLVPHTLP